MTKELTPEQIAEYWPEVDQTPTTPWITKSVVPSPNWYVKMDVPDVGTAIEKPCPVFFVQERRYGDETEIRVIPTIFDEDGYATEAVDLDGFKGVVSG